MQWIVCVILNTTLGACQLSTETVSASDQRRRERMGGGIENTCNPCFVDTAPTLLGFGITASTFQKN